MTLTLSFSLGDPTARSSLAEPKFISGARLAILGCGAIFLAARWGIALSKIYTS